MVYVHLATGFEEVEALTVIDLLRRAGIEVKSVSITGEKRVMGTHNIPVEADIVFEEADYASCEMIVLPGGLPGADYLGEHEGLTAQIRDFAANDKYLAAICAAPSVLAELGILDGKKGTSYPGFGTKIENFVDEPVVVDGNVITSRGLGAAIDFGLALIELLVDEQKAKEIAAAIQYRQEEY